MFWSRPFISDDLREWIEECFGWFSDTFPPPAAPILPIREFFTAGRGTDPDTAAQVLADIKRHMRFDPPVDLMPLDQIPAEYRHSYQAMSAVSGTYQNFGNHAVIRYDPELMHRPIQFINMLTHELMHARLEGYQAEVPGGVEAHELATDLGCIIAGFGIFQLQAADEAGWSGYMSQETRAFALALFLSRRALGPDAVSPHLSARNNKRLKQAFKAL